MKCSICTLDYYGYPSRGDEVDPPEMCWCGEAADGSVWAWSGWEGIRKAIRYRLALKLYDLIEWLTHDAG